MKYYENIEDVNILKTFYGAYNWFRKRYGTVQFKIKLQLIPMDNVYDYPVMDNHDLKTDTQIKVKRIKHVKKKIRKMGTKTQSTYSETRNYYSELGELIDDDSEDRILSDIITTDKEIYGMEDVKIEKCTISTIKPEATNNFVLVSSKSHNNALGITSFRSLILVSESLIPPSEEFIQEALETTSCLVDKLKEIITVKDETITNQRNIINQLKSYINTTLLPSRYGRQSTVEIGTQTASLFQTLSTLSDSKTYDYETDMSDEISMISDPD